MFKPIVKAVTEEYSGLRAKGYVAEIVQHHRIQASPGYRAAAELCRQQLTDFGLAAEVLSFPVTEQTHYWGIPMFQEWDCSAATLHLVEPADKASKLADYSEVKCSLIQRSIPVDGHEFEVVLLEDGEDESEYQGLDLQDKIVLTKGDLDRVRELAVDRHGAAGILFDGMGDMPPVRQRIDMADVCQYKSFWWRIPGQKKCFGFVLSPRSGDELRALIKARGTEGQAAVRVRANVASRLYDGYIEVVSGLIAGQTEEEVLVVAHLCHPQPSANDNASGSAAVLELARTLQRLIDSGTLPQPRRSIRLLFVPEMTGTYAYLATHEDELSRFVAGVNLDMVGENQALCGSVFIVEHTPAAHPSFTGDLLERLRQEWIHGAPNPAATASYPLFRYTATPFSGGSDHYILSDPAVGIPTPMLIQWPDKYWHTSEDTLDKVDADMLGVVGGLAASYAYFVANAGAREAHWLGLEMLARFRARLARTVQDGLTDALATKQSDELAAAAAKTERKIHFMADRQCQAIDSLSRLAHGQEPVLSGLRAEVELAAHGAWEGAQKALQEPAQHLGLEGVPPLEPPQPDEWDQRAEKMVPARVYRGPVTPFFYLHRLSQAEREEAYGWLKEHQLAYRSSSVLANYWVDGTRAVADIADLVEMETGQRNVELLVRHFELLGRLGLMTLQDAET
jgi:aminopeptidase YwaD